MKNAITRFLRDEEGATAIEYGVIAGLMAVLLIGIFGSTTAGFGGAITTLFSNIATKLSTAVTS
jgi:pilus assembly protein Flp/PilA